MAIDFSDLGGQQINTPASTIDFSDLGGQRIDSGFNPMPALKAGAAQVLSQPDIQPFQGINPFSKPQGGPVQQVLGSMRQLASLPLRYSQTLGQASQPVSELTAEQLGSAGANPYVSAAAGMVAGAAVDPRSWIPAGGISADHPNELPWDIAQAREARTGVPARKFQALYRDPGALFAGGNIQQAGQDIGAAKEAAGVSPGVQYENLGSLTPENITAARSPRTAGKVALNSILTKLAANEGTIEGSGITIDELSSALQDSNARLAKLPPGTQPFQQESAIKNNLQNILSEVSPEVKAANAAYARAKLGETFSGMNAVNKSGSPSKSGLIARGGSGLLGAVAGHVVPGINPLEGMGAGYMLAKYGSQAYHAPFVAGLQTAGGAMVNRAIDPLLEQLEKVGTTPAMQAYISRYLQQQGGNQQ